MRTAFDGSAAKLVRHALGNESTSVEDLDEIERMIAEAKARRSRPAKLGRLPLLRASAAPKKS